MIFVCVYELRTMKINRTVGIIGYIFTMLLCAYLTFADALVLYMQSLGMQIVIYHPALGFSEEYSGQFTIIPNIIEFLYIFLTWIFFAIIGYRKIWRVGKSTMDEKVMITFSEEAFPDLRKLLELKNLKCSYCNKRITKKNVGGILSKKTYICKDIFCIIHAVNDDKTKKGVL